MKTRIITAIVGLPFLIAPIFIGGLSIYVLVFLLSLVGSYELLKANKIQDKGIMVINYAMTVIYYAFLWFFGTTYFGYILAGYFLLLLIYYVLRFPTLTFEMISISVMTFFYLTYLLSHMVMVRQIPHYGGWMVWLIFIIGFGSDTFAYFTGVFFGKHKLAKVLSPKKTIEGAIGGIVGAVLLTLGFTYIMEIRGIFEMPYQPVLFIMMGIFGAVLSIFGDLAASAIKRQTGIKDYGKLLPGHGGILDRFDSNIFTAPFVYYCIILWMDYIK